MINIEEFFVQNFQKKFKEFNLSFKDAKLFGVWKDNAVQQIDRVGWYAILTTPNRDVGVAFCVKVDEYVSSDYYKYSWSKDIPKMIRKALEDFLCTQH